MRRFTLVCGSCLITLAVLVTGFLTSQDSRSSKLYRLLHGDGSVAISRFNLGAWPKATRKGAGDWLSSPAATSFLASAFLKSKEVYIPQTRKYSRRYGRIKFVGGGDEVVALYLADTKDFLVVGFPVDRYDDMSFYEVVLEGPLPDDLGRALDVRPR